jgi:hypothetical protein
VLPLLVAGVVVAGLLLAWSLYRTYAGDGIHGQVTAFRIASDSQVIITFEVVGAGAEPAKCTVRARSRDGREVGRAEVPVPTGAEPAGRKGRDPVVVTYPLATTGRAVTGELVGCARSEPR